MTTRASATGRLLFRSDVYEVRDVVSRWLSDLECRHHQG